MRFDLCFDANDDARLVVVSNRLPYDLPRGPGRAPRRNVSGLVSALEPVLRERGGSWIGWDGVVLPSNEAAQRAEPRSIVVAEDPPFRIDGVALSEREVGSYYHGFANRALWPLFHEFTTQAVFNPEDYATYERINRRFARLVRERATADSRVWVHDFHLTLVPRMLRELGFRGPLDFFLHIPFPPPEIFRILPWRTALLEGLLAADTIGFHIPLYRDNFVASACQLAGATAEGADARGGVRLVHERGTSSALAVPIGIDVDEFERVSRLPAVERRAERLRELHGDVRILLSVDRLDYTKGIGERLRGLERFLTTHPEWQRRIVLLQIVVPSRHQVEEYRAMKREIDRQVGRINGELGRAGWMPIHYRYRAFDREELVAHYRAADVMLVTPLRDGMNLVAPEFAATRVDEDGILVLSELAGIAERSPGAILVNPYDVDGCVRAIAQALDMDREERGRRMRELRARVRSNPVRRWAARCLGAGELARGAAP
jgi:trehalose 6-phosphate synthase